MRQSWSAGLFVLSACSQQADVPGLAPKETLTVPFATVAPVVAHTATVLPAPGADPIARFHQQVGAELKLTALEHAVQRLAERLSSAPAHRPRVPRRSRRSAWVAST